MFVHALYLQVQSLCLPPFVVDDQILHSSNTPLHGARTIQRVYRQHIDRRVNRPRVEGRDWNRALFVRRRCLRSELRCLLAGIGKRFPARPAGKWSRRGGKQITLAGRTTAIRGDLTGGRVRPGGDGSDDSNAYRAMRGSSRGWNLVDFGCSLRFLPTLGVE